MRRVLSPLATSSKEGKITRVRQEPAFILHSRDWSESSLILEVFTRHRGRTTIVANGAKKHTSNFRPVLLALQPLRLHYTMSNQNSQTLHSLRGAEWVGGHTLPQGKNLLTGLYLNELLLRLLAPDDPFAYLFDVYSSLVRLLATSTTSSTTSTAAHEAVLPSALRGFELILLRELGLLPELDVDESTSAALGTWTLDADDGLRPARAGEAHGLEASHWQSLARALEQGEQSYAATVKVCAGCSSALKPQLRQLLQHHCGQPLLRTQQLMQDFLELSRS